MAQRVQVLLVCDVHGDDTPGTETISFALDGTGYELDVCEQHAAELRDRFAAYVGVGRRSGGRSAAGRGSAGNGRRRSSREGAPAGQAAQIREWARSQGLAVPERGRIPAELAERYAAAHG